MDQEAKPTSEVPWSADDIYRQLGMFVVCFQDIESRLAEICWFLSDPSYAPEARRTIAQLSYADLIRETRRRVKEFLEGRDLNRPEWSQQTEAVLGNCRELGYLRNRLVHSTYVHLEGGGELLGIVRSNFGSHDGSLDQEWLGPESFAQAFKNVAETVFTLGLAKTQIIHWSAWSDGEPAAE